MCRHILPTRAHFRVKGLVCASAFLTIWRQCIANQFARLMFDEIKCYNLRLQASSLLLA